MVLEQCQIVSERGQECIRWCKERSDVVRMVSDCVEWCQELSDNIQMVSYVDGVRWPQEGVRKVSDSIIKMSEGARNV